MKILIIEDKPLHILCAEQFAKETDHEITILTTYHEAEEALCGNDKFGDKNRFGRYPYEQKFDVLLTDLLLPASKAGQGDDKYTGQEMPYGVALALLAMRTGVKKIGLLTDGNHHNHPFIWALDPLGGYDGKPFMINDIKLLFASNNFIHIENWKNTNIESVPKGDPRSGGKAWHLLFATLLAD